MLVLAQIPAVESYGWGRSAEHIAFRLTNGEQSQNSLMMVAVYQYRTAIVPFKPKTKQRRIDMLCTDFDGVSAMFLLAAFVILIGLGQSVADDWEAKRRKRSI